MCAHLYLFIFIIVHANFESNWRKKPLAKWPQNEWMKYNFWCDWNVEGVWWFVTLTFITRIHAHFTVYMERERENSNQKPHQEKPETIIMLMKIHSLIMAIHFIYTRQLSQRLHCLLVYIRCLWKIIAKRTSNRWCILRDSNACCCYLFLSLPLIHWSNRL